MGTRYFSGVDLHKAVLQVCVLDAHGQIVAEKRFRYSNLQEGLRVVACLQKWGPHCRVVVEALGLNRHHLIVGVEKRRLEELQAV